MIEERMIVLEQIRILISQIQKWCPVLFWMSLTDEQPINKFVTVSKRQLPVNWSHNDINLWSDFWRKYEKIMLKKRKQLKGSITSL